MRKWRQHLHPQMVGIQKQREICQLWSLGGCLSLIYLISGCSLSSVNTMVLDTLLLELPVSPGNMLTDPSPANISSRASAYGLAGYILHSATDTIHRKLMVSLRLVQYTVHTTIHSSPDYSTVLKQRSAYVLHCLFDTEYISFCLPGLGK